MSVERPYSGVKIPNVTNVGVHPLEPYTKVLRTDQIILLDMILTVLAFTYLSYLRRE